jgi:tetratricopeptide (TPR) repeat protein
MRHAGLVACRAPIVAAAALISMLVAMPRAGLAAMSADEAAQALRANPKDVPARIILIQADIANASYGPAEKLADDGIKVVPDDAQLWAARGAASFNDGVTKRSNGDTGTDALKTAAASYDEAMKLDAHAVSADEASAAFAQYGLVLWQEQQYAPCLVYADEAARTNPRAWQYGMLKGDCESGMQDYKAAIADYQAAMQRDDHNNPTLSSRLLAALGNAQLRAGDEAGGLQSLSKAEALDPNAPFAYQTLYAYYSSRPVPDLDKVLDALEHLALLEPTNPRVQIDTGTIYVREGKFDQAKEAFNKAMQMDPKNADAQFGMAEVAAAQGDMKSTDSALEKAIALNPSDASFYNASIAQLVLTLPSSSKGLQTNQSVIAPGATETFSATSEHAVQAQQYADAATRADANDGTAWYWLGIAYAEQGRKDLAAGSLRKAQEIFSSKSCVDIHFVNRGGGTSCLEYQKMMLAQTNTAYSQLNDNSATLMGTHGAGGGTGKSITTNGDMPH